MTDSSQHHKEHLHTIRSVSLGTIWRAARFPFVVLSAILIPRLMGDTLYGDYAIFMSIYLMLDIVTDVGVTQIFGRFLPELKAKDADQVAPLLHSMLFYGIIITLLVILFTEFKVFQGQLSNSRFFKVADTLDLIIKLIAPGC